MPRSVGLPAGLSADCLFVPAAIACFAAVCAGCGPPQVSVQKPTSKPLPTIRAAVLRVEPQKWPAIVRSQGSLEADEVAEIGAKVAGPVAQVHVDLGDVVSAGQPLVTLDQEQFELEVQQTEAQLNQARSAIGLGPDDPLETLEPQNSPPVRQEQAMWNEAKANLERARQLQIDRTITRAEFDAIFAAERVAEARFASAVNSVLEKIALIRVRQAELSLARERLEYAVIRAPLDGVVQERRVAPGAYVQIGGAIATLVRTNPLRFRGSIPERHAQGLAVGQQVVLKIESIDEPRRVHVTRISPALDNLTRSLIFEAEVDNSDHRLRSGLFAEAEVLIDPQAEAIVAPYSAVVEFAGAEKVWKIVDGVAAEQEVLTGERRPQGIEILRGLAVGDVILSDASEGQIATVEPVDSSVADERAQEDGELSGGESSGGESSGAGQSEPIISG